MSETQARYFEAINQALREEMIRDERVVLFGTDVAAGGHVFAATRGLYDEFGPQRVRDTPISELGMVGAAVGAAMAGLRPIVDVLFMDFLPLALDQILNQASKIRYMTAGGFQVPMTLLTLCGAGKENGPQHSQNLEAWLGSIPGITVAIPATPRDVKASMKSAIRSEDPAIVIQSLALWHSRGPVGGPDELDDVGKATVARTGLDVTIVSVGRMLDVALEAAAELAKQGVDSEVIDLRYVSPLDVDTLVRSVRQTGAALVLYEAVEQYGVGAEVVAVLQAEAFDYLDAPVLRVASPFTHIPASAALEKLRIPSVERVVSAAHALRGTSGSSVVR